MNIPFDFLISTSKSILLYKNNTIHELQNNKGVYFGLGKTDFLFADSNTPKKVYAALARNNFDGTGGGNPMGLNSLELFNDNFQYLTSISTDYIKDGHQIFFHNHHLYITNTGLNIITRIHPDGKVSFITLYDRYGTDINHCNSINFVDNKWYICQHRTVEGLDDGGVSIFNTNWELESYIPIGKHPHGCYVYDGYLFSFDSYHGRLWKINLQNHDDKTVYDIAPGYLTRGLIINDNYLLCGLSEFDSRDNRHSNKIVRIKAFNYHTMEYLSTLEIDNVGQCNDLLLA